MSGNSLAVQWLGLLASTAGDPRSVPGGGTNIPQAAQRGNQSINVHVIVTARK